MSEVNPQAANEGQPPQNLHSWPKRHGPQARCATNRGHQLPADGNGLKTHEVGRVGPLAGVVAFVKVQALLGTVLVVVVREAVQHGVRDPGKPEQQSETKQNSTH